MESYKVFIKPSAVKELEAIPQKKIRQQIVNRIQALSKDPRPPGTKKLSGHDCYRVRHGVHRVVYAVDDNAGAVTVVKVGHRKDIYRGAL